MSTGAVYTAPVDLYYAWTPRRSLGGVCTIPEAAPKPETYTMPVLQEGALEASTPYLYLSYAVPEAAHVLET